MTAGTDRGAEVATEQFMTHHAKISARLLGSVLSRVHPELAVDAVRLIVNEIVASRPELSRKLAHELARELCD